MEAFQRDEQEGDNLEHTHDEKPDTSLPRFKTAGGRTVLGGGGITPDYVVKSASLTGLVQTVWRKNLFYDFAKNTMDAQGATLRNTYASGVEDFKARYSVTDGMMAEFKKFIESKDIKVDEKEYTKDLNFLKARLKAQIAQMLYGFEAYVTIMIDYDNQIQKALTLFPEAQKIAKLE